MYSRRGSGSSTAVPPRAAARAGTGAASVGRVSIGSGSGPEYRFSSGSPIPAGATRTPVVDETGGGASSGALDKFASPTLAEVLLGDDASVGSPAGPLSDDPRLLWLEIQRLRRQLSLSEELRQLERRAASAELTALGAAAANNEFRLKN